MGLTSTAVLAVVAALAVALFAATVRLWPRLARPGAAAVSGRIGLLLATQLTLFAAVGLAANNAFLFYGSWADLFGRKQEL
ncbi:esterase, partial [Streptomyces sp. SID7982]|nr:esterase [Streptomyces sp. SID7982]